MSMEVFRGIQWRSEGKRRSEKYRKGQKKSETVRDCEINSGKVKRKSGGVR